jgi:predicted small secreted protein
MSALSFRNRKEGWDMLRAFVISAVVLGSLAVAACNTVRGAAADVNSVANCTENTINPGRGK